MTFGQREWLIETLPNVRASAIVTAMSDQYLLAAEETYGKTRDAIWNMELAIYEARSKGDLGTYAESSSIHMAGWPPQATEPVVMANSPGFKQGLAGQNRELLSMRLAHFTLSGDTAVIYYHTHRTRLPNGEAADERFAICHVWTREQEKWKLIGAMGRKQ